SSYRDRWPPGVRPARRTPCPAEQGSPPAPHLPRDPLAATSADTSGARECPAPGARLESKPARSCEKLRSSARSASSPQNPWRQARSQKARADPDYNTGGDVAWVVTPGVHARVGDGPCQRTKDRREDR